MSKHSRKHRSSKHRKRTNELGIAPKKHQNSHNQGIRHHIMQLDSYLRDIDISGKPDHDRIVEMIMDYLPYSGEVDLDDEIRTAFTSEELEEYSRGTDRIKLIDKVLQQAKQIAELQRLQPRITDLTATFIELLDLTKLPAIATRGFVRSLLDQLELKLSEVSSINTSNLQSEIKDWKGRIQPTLSTRLFAKNKELLGQKLCEKLELDVGQWIDQFRFALTPLEV